ncbi:MAG: FAD-dependent oxidoreductase, partial [Clostridiales bacterium]|nr:FAD-dependent oxidoreductase [Clostridiales bacterium]
MNSNLRHLTHSFKLCVIGGGLAGMCAAVAAARHGAKVALIHDRPVLGGNASSEIRMWPLGCHGEHNRESGIIEEIFVKNMFRNPIKNYSVWDSILYETVRFEKNIELFLNCSCADCETDGNRIISVDAWQLTTYTWYTIKADIFIDCSGDSILAPLSGAAYRVGRESFSEFGEPIGHEKSDRKTMGMSCLIQAIETEKPSYFTPPPWANVYETDESLCFRGHSMKEITQNFWWIELGGEDDSIHDTEKLRDELLKVAFGVWDHIKNRGDHGADNWELSWIGFLPGKRESRRYEGDYILKQHDLAQGTKFDDVVAYGGWPMDDHDPAGFHHKGAPNINHPVTIPYGIPYRCLYSRNVDNLMFAGRNISVTHAALSSTRVMATCAVIGQAAGTAASIAIKEHTTPRGVYKHHIKFLQSMLLEDDTYLPGMVRDIPAVTANASLTGFGTGIENIRNGIDRHIESYEDNMARLTLGKPLTYAFSEATDLRRLRILFDSDLERATIDGHRVLRRYPMIANKFLDSRE